MTVIARLRIFISLLVAVSLISFSFPVHAESPSSKYGGQLVFATTSDPKSFNDMVAKETSTSMVTAFLFEGLTRRNTETLKVEPNLAERWTVSEDVFFAQGRPLERRGSLDGR